MTRLFGTDGIRGAANVDLRPSLAFALGRATAHEVVGAGGSLVVGQDTRRSGDMFVAAITAGATSMGVDVHSVGVVPTPALAFLAGGGRVRRRDHGLGVAQPGRGQRPQGARPVRPEARRRRRGGPRGARAPAPTSCRACRRPGSGGPWTRAGCSQRYVAHRTGLAAAIHGERPPRRPRRRERRRLPGRARDPAGDRRPGDRDPRRSPTATTSTAAAARPTRRRSPRRSSSTAPTSGSRSTATRTGAWRSTARAGSSTATRCSASSRSSASSANALDRGSLVVSVLSNGGLQHAVEQAGGRIVRTPVGDKHILAAMLVSGAGLGGEKSGHVIVREHSTSGDGIVTALELLRVMTAAGSGLDDAGEPHPAPAPAAAGDPGPPPRPVGERRRPAGRRSPMRRRGWRPTAGSSSVPRAPNPCCG